MSDQRPHNAFKRFLASEDGPTATEYAVLLALIIVACLGSVTLLGNNWNANWQMINSAMFPG